jgi:hypothetical protein
MSSPLQHGKGDVKMKYLPVRCKDHGWVLLDAESFREGDHVIDCEGHFFAKNTRGMTFFLETAEHLPKTRGLSDNEFAALKRKIEAEQRNKKDCA